MAIDINNGLGPLNQGGQKTAGVEADLASKRKSATGDTSASSRDEVNISEDANSMRAMQARLERQQSFDEARVAQIRDAISEGRYPIDNQRLAENFLKLESKL